MYFPDENRVELVRDLFRQAEEDGTPVRLESLIETLPMGRKTAWKALQHLIDIGAVSREKERSPTGHIRYVYTMGEWDLMTEEQRTEVMGILNEIRDSAKTPKRTLTINLHIDKVEHMHVGEESLYGDTTGNP